MNSRINTGMARRITPKNLLTFYFAISILLFLVPSIVYCDPPQSTERSPTHLKGIENRSTAEGDSFTGLACSAIGLLIKENGNQIPKSIKELVTALDEHGSLSGGVQRVIVPFSQSPFSSSLERPRILIQTRGRTNGDTPKYKSNKPYLELNKRLFTAVTFNADGSQTLEFLSWNYSKRNYDFGVIENFNRPSKRKIIFNPEQTRQCMSCHKTGGPIFPADPWSNTTNGHGATEMAFLAKQSEIDPANYSKVQKRGITS